MSTTSLHLVGEKPEIIGIDISCACKADSFSLKVAAL
jgi:hypothetical protein